MRSPLDIWNESPLYAIKLGRAFKVNEEDHKQDWFLALHLAHDTISKDHELGKCKKSDSLCRVVGYRNLIRQYKAQFARSKLDPCEWHRQGLLMPKGIKSAIELELLQEEILAEMPYAWKADAWGAKVKNK